MKYLCRTFLFISLSCCRLPPASAEGGQWTELELSTANKPLAAATTAAQDAPAQQAAAGKPAVYFCDTLKQRLAPPVEDKRKIQPGPPNYTSAAAKQRLAQARDKEKKAVKICDIALKQRAAAVKHEESAAKAPAAGAAKLALAGNLYRMADRLEITASVLYDEAYALRAAVERGGR